MMLRNFSVPRLIALCAAGAVALASTPASAWEFAHGNRDNSGFANAVTAPAGKGSVSVPGLGKFAPGAGPVVALDGTVYVGTIEGKLVALHADGSPFWSRDITPGQSIVASPAISSDGSIYVIGVGIERENRPDARVASATLHHFNNTGAWLGQIAFPQHGEVGPAAFSPPNIWRSGGAEAIMIPAVYRNKVTGGYSVRLIAFSLTGQVLDDKVVKNITPQSFGGTGKPDWQVWSCVAWPLNASLWPHARARRPEIPGKGRRPRPASASLPSPAAEHPSSWCRTTTRTWSASPSPASN